MPDVAGKGLLRQPKSVWAVAFACVIAFMGIGLVDPILPAIARDLRAIPSQVELLFTSYMLITGVAMLVTGVVSSRIGPKRTLLGGLALGHRRRGRRDHPLRGRLRVGIATGPLLGGELGALSWRGPFFGTATLMAVAFVAVAVLLAPMPAPTRRSSVLDPFGRCVTVGCARWR